jgi:Interferon-induced transmembrane protein
MPRDPDGFTEEPERPRRYNDEDDYRRRRDDEDDFDFRRDDVRVPNYLVPAILATVLCCPALGAVGIVFAAQVDGKVRSGDVEGARRASKAALTWCWVAFGVGLLVNCLGLALGVASEALK